MGALEILLVADVSPVGPQGGAERFLQAEAQALGAEAPAGEHVEPDQSVDGTVQYGD